MNLDLAQLARHDMVLVMLPTQRKRAITISRLAKHLGYPKREVEQALQDLASSGRYPIVATERGIYLAGDPSDVEEYVGRLQARLVTQYVRVRALRRCARAMRGQRNLTLWGAA